MKKEKKELIWVLTGLSIAVTSALFWLSVYLITVLKLIKNDRADFLTILPILIIPVFSITGVVFSSFGLTKTTRTNRIFAISGLAIDIILFILVAIFWIKFYLFFSSFRGWID